jgi:hypothetical protein
MRKSATKMIASHASRPTTIPEHLGVRPPGRTQRACPSPGQLEPASKKPPCLEGGRLGRRARRGRQAHATVRAPPWIVRPHNGALDPPGRGTDGRRLSDCTSPKVGVAAASSSKNAKLFLTLGVCYRRGADGPLGRRSGFRYGRCRLSWLLRAVPRVCRSSAFASASGSVARAMSRSRRSFQRAWGVSSWPPPVGRGSWGSMPLAARHTAISRTRAVLG